jgi:hypothetical protein
MKMTTLRESFFDEPSLRSSQPSMSDLEGDLSFALAEGRVGWALWLGAIGGAGGGAAMLLTANEVAHRMHVTVDIVQTVGAYVRGAGRLVGADVFQSGIALAMVIGAVVGVLVGALLRYSVRLRSRVLAGAMIGATLWIIFQAFILKSIGSKLASLPLVPMLAGAAVYGLCVAILPPPRKKIVVDDDDPEIQRWK